MGVRQITLGNFVKYNGTKIGTVLVDKAKYISADEGEYGPIHVFKGSKGAPVKLPSAGMLDGLLEVAGLNSTVTIVYEGKAKIRSGKWKGKPSHQFRVSVHE